MSNKGVIHPVLGLPVGSKDRKTRKETPEQLENLRELEKSIAAWRERRFKEMEDEATRPMFFTNLGEDNENAGSEECDGD